MEGFRKAVMGAKRALCAGSAPAASASAGADKGSAGGGGSDGGATQAQMLRVLERIEAAIAEGVTTLRAPQRA